VFPVHGNISLIRFETGFWKFPFRAARRRYRSARHRTDSYFGTDYLRSSLDSRYRKYINVIRRRARARLEVTRNGRKAVTSREARKRLVGTKLINSRPSVAPVGVHSCQISPDFPD